LFRLDIFVSDNSHVALHRPPRSLFLQRFQTARALLAATRRIAVIRRACIFVDIYKRAPRFRRTAKYSQAAGFPSPHLRSKWRGGVRGRGIADK
jgi:hypothetical protein